MTTAQLSQCMEALARANSVRVTQADLRREIFALPLEDGCERVAELLTSGEPLAIPVGRLLLSIRNVGEWRMHKFLKQAEIFSPTKRVRALTPRQRTKLASVLRNRWMVS